MQTTKPFGPRRLRTSFGIGLVAAALLLTACDSSSEPDATVAPVAKRSPIQSSAADEKQRPPTPPIKDGEATVRGNLMVSPGRVDLGLISPKSVHPLVFELKNQGPNDITIVVTKPTCLCTTLDDLNGQVIKPGESLPLKATFNAPTELGDKHGKVQIIFAENGVEDRALIGFGGQIAMEIQPDPPYVDALKNVTRGTITLASTDGRAFRVLSTDGGAPAFADGFDPASDTPKSTYELRWNIPQRNADNCSGMRLWWIVETDDEVCPIIPVRVRHTCTGGNSDPNRRRRGWIFSEPIVALGAVQGGETIDVAVKLTEMPNSQGQPGRADITTVRSATGGSRVELRSIERVGDKYVLCHLRVTPDSQVRGMMYDMVRFDSPTGGHEVAMVAKVQ